MWKICSRCKESKKIVCYYKAESNKDGYSGRCKECIGITSKIHRVNNKEKIAAKQNEYYLANKEKFKEVNKTYREEHKEEMKQYAKEYYKEYNEKNKEKLKEQSRIRNKKYREENVDKIKKYEKKYREDNKEKIQEYSRKYREENKDIILASPSNTIEYRREHRKKNKEKLNKQKSIYRKNLPPDSKYKLSRALRTRLSGALKVKNSKKACSIIKLLGCSIDSLREHLSSQFTAGMSWENYGQYGWHIDHIKPCASFDLSNPAEQATCFHYTNLQPLWATKEIALSYGEGLDYIGNLEKGFTEL